MALWTKTSCNTFTLMESSNICVTTDIWQSCPIAGFDSEYGAHDFWTDGTNIYFSHNEIQYVLNKESGAWEQKDWSGLTSFRGHQIWTDGTNIYYSNADLQYVLNKETLTWETKVWNGETAELDGWFIWKDGDNIYHNTQYDFSGDEKINRQYVLNKETDTWETKTWNGLDGFYGGGIWSDGENIYYSWWHDHYIFNRENETWEVKTWDRLPYSPNGIIGKYIWTDGVNIYVNGEIGNNYYSAVLNGNSWDEVSWKGQSAKLDAGEFWTDGNNIFYTNYNSTACLSSEMQMYTRQNGEWVKTGVVTLQ